MAGTQEHNKWDHNTGEHNKWECSSVPQHNHSTRSTSIQGSNDYCDRWHPKENWHELHVQYLIKVVNFTPGE